MKVEIYYNNDDEIYIGFEGNIFAETLPELKKALNIVLDSSVKKAIVDFSSVEAITSYGLKELILFRREMEKQNRKVDFINRRSIVSELFKIANKVYA